MREKDAEKTLGVLPAERETDSCRSSAPEQSEGETKRLLWYENTTIEHTHTHTISEEWNILSVLSSPTVYFFHAIAALTFNMKWVIVCIGRERLSSSNLFCPPLRYCFPSSTGLLERRKSCWCLRSSQTIVSPPQLARVMEEGPFSHHSRGLLRGSWIFLVSLTQ